MKVYKTIYSHFIRYPVPYNINSIYSLGSILGIIFLMQILTGLLLTLYYIPNASLAFTSIEYIMRDVKGGWYLRYFHINGASFIFFLIYLHMGKAIYYNIAFTWKSRLVWITGYIIFILTIAVGFLGYVLPWGQMSFWGTTVITQLVSIIPIIGNRLVIYVWGGFEVTTITLQRCFVLHYCLPFLILIVILLHINFMHNSIVSSKINYYLKDINFITLHPYFTIKDFFYFLCSFLSLITIICFYPERFTNPVNYIPSTLIKTPSHIIPEWYFLPLYATLKVIPNKIGGITAMLSFLCAPLILAFDNEIGKSIRDNLLLFTYFIYSCVKYSELTSNNILIINKLLISEIIWNNWLLINDILTLLDNNLFIPVDLLIDDIYLLTVYAVEILYKMVELQNICEDWNILYYIQRLPQFFDVIIVDTLYLYIIYIFKFLNLGHSFYDDYTLILKIPLFELYILKCWYIIKILPFIIIIMNFLEKFSYICAIYYLCYLPLTILFTCFNLFFWDEVKDDFTIIKELGNEIFWGLLNCYNFITVYSYYKLTYLYYNYTLFLILYYSRTLSLYLIFTNKLVKTTNFLNNFFIIKGIYFKDLYFFFFTGNFLILIDLGYWPITDFVSCGFGIFLLYMHFFFLLNKKYF